MTVITARILYSFSDSDRKGKMKHSKIFNVLFLLLGLLCIWYYIGMGLAVRFGQSLLWVWPVVGVLCIVRFAAVARSIRTGKPLPFSGKTVRTFRILTCLALTVFFAGEAVICTGAFEKPEEGLDCIIVLGAKVNGTKPSGALTQRIWAAADYLNGNPDCVCIASGGQGDDEGISEAQCIKENLVALGIDESRIILEDRATDTRTNIVYSLALAPEGSKKIGLVTNDFHIFRALATARKVSELEFSGIPAASSAYGFIHYAMREFFAVGGGLLKGELKII